MNEPNPDHYWLAQIEPGAFTLNTSHWVEDYHVKHLSTNARALWLELLTMACNSAYQHSSWVGGEVEVRHPKGAFEGLGLHPINLAQAMDELACAGMVRNNLMDFTYLQRVQLRRAKATT